MHVFLFLFVKYLIFVVRLFFSSSVLAITFLQWRGKILAGGKDALMAAI
jgi:hypothetical protein